MPNYTDSTKNVNNDKLKTIFLPRSPHLRSLNDAWNAVQSAVHTASEKNISRALIVLDRETLLSYIED